jgi:hypothetical protein
MAPLSTTFRSVTAATALVVASLGAPTYAQSAQPAAASATTAAVTNVAANNNVRTDANTTTFADRRAALLASTRSGSATNSRSSAAAARPETVNNTAATAGTFNAEATTAEARAIAESERAADELSFAKPVEIEGGQVIKTSAGRLLEHNAETGHTHIVIDGVREGRNVASCVLEEMLRYPDAFVITYYRAHNVDTPNFNPEFNDRFWPDLQKATKALARNLEGAEVVLIEVRPIVGRTNAPGDYSEPMLDSWYFAANNNGMMPDRSNYDIGKSGLGYVNFLEAGFYGRTHYTAMPGHALFNMKDGSIELHRNTVQTYEEQRNRIGGALLALVRDMNAEIVARKGDPKNDSTLAQATPAPGK